MKQLLMAIVAAITFAGSFSQAIEEVSLRWKTGWYNTGDTLVHRFDRATYVERMLISAEGYRAFAKAYVYADGDLVSVLGVPGNDPDYPVVIRKKTNSIVVKFEGSVRIIDFRMYLGDSVSQTYQQLSTDDLQTPAELGKAVIRIVADLQYEVSHEEFKQYFLPLRQSALILSAKGMGRPLLSDNTQKQARVMIAQIKRAEAFLLGRLSRSDEYTDHVQTLLFVKEKLEAIYEIY